MNNNAGPSNPNLALSGFVGGIWSPEDLAELPGTSWIVVSGMRSARHPGRLFVAHGRRSAATALGWEASAEPARISADMFDPHGIAARRRDSGTFELLVVDHGGGEAIDRLTIELQGGVPVITRGDRIVQPVNTSANAVAWLPDDGFVMTSMFDPADRQTLAKFARAEATGGVWRWSPDRGWSRFGGLQLSGANGIAASPDGTLVIVCEWAARRVWQLTGDGSPIKHVETDFLPDNLRWSADGRLLLAGQSARPEAVFGCEARGEVCPLAFRVVLLDPVSLKMEPLIVMSEREARDKGFGGATGALEVDRNIWVGSFTGERIGVFSRPA